MKRKSYRVGNVFKICEGSGIDSNKLCTCIPMFDWHKSTDGTYRSPGLEMLPVRYENGNIGFFYKSRLIRMSEADIFDHKL